MCSRCVATVRSSTTKANRSLPPLPFTRKTDSATTKSARLSDETSPTLIPVAKSKSTSAKLRSERYVRADAPQTLLLDKAADFRGTSLARWCCRAWAKSSPISNSLSARGSWTIALQVLQALAGVIVAWPLEGLLALRGVVGHSEPRIRRATIRILAEAFNRHPEETLQFLKSSGAAVSDEELIEIKIRQDARIGRRQVDEREWARIGHCLIRRPAARQLLGKSLRVLLRAENVHDAIAGVLTVLGFVGPTGR
jgi:hypothetical protein